MHIKVSIRRQYCQFRLQNEISADNKASCEFITFAAL